MSFPIFFMDVNIPMYAAGTDHPYKAASLWVMKEVAEGRIDVVIDTEIIQEILHRYSAIGQPRIGITMASNLLDLIPMVYPVRVADIRKAIQLFDKHYQQGMTSRDALHAAVMEGNGLTYLLSADHHFDLIAGVKRIAVQTVYQVRADVKRAHR